MNAEANPTSSSTETNDSLQFDRAEFNQSAAFPCAFCKAPIAGDYFQVNGQTSCPNCREQLNAAMAGGSKTLRALRALAAGTVAGVGGFLIYWGVRALTGYEVGLISILLASWSAAQCVGAHKSAADSSTNSWPSSSPIFPSHPAILPTS